MYMQFYGIKHILTSTRLLIRIHERNTIKLHVQVFLRMNTWLSGTCRNQYNWIKLLMKNVCILLIFVTCLWCFTASAWWTRFPEVSTRFEEWILKMKLPLWSNPLSTNCSALHSSSCPYAFRCLLTPSAGGFTPTTIRSQHIKYLCSLFYILVTVHLGLILINNQPDVQFLLYIFISVLYMFRANLCSSSGESIVQYNIWYMSLCREGRNFPTCIPDGHLHRLAYTRCCIDTTDSPDDEHKVARNM
jgi:hypothetical protein